MKSIKQNPNQPSQDSELEEILEENDKREIRALFSFDKTTSEDEIIDLFNLWVIHFFPKFLEFGNAPFHDTIDRNNVRCYRGDIKYFVDIAFRGAAKTTRTKLFVAFAIANDEDHFRRYIKVLSADGSNSKQIVTDVYNLLINRNVIAFYPEIFQKTEEKRQEAMSVFTTATGVKMQADSVGTDQRGDIQEEARPDYIWFDDFEVRKTLRSAVVTHAIWDNMEEARNGLSKNGSALYNCNYISERGNVHKLVEKKSSDKVVLITPIKDKTNRPAWPEAYTIGDINKIEENADDFAGEYMCEPSAGADIFFDRASVTKQVALQAFRDIAGFKMFHKYVHDHRYGIGVDVAGGIGLDSSSVVIIDFSTFPSKVVATFHDNFIKPNVFGDEIKQQADRYGAPITAVENNKYDMVIGRLRQIYDNLYFTETDETRVGLPPKVRHYGWNTNADTKPKMFFALKKAVEDGHLELTDEDLIFEARSYGRDDLLDGEVDPRLTTRHFDLLTAAAIAYQMKGFAEVSKEETETFKQGDYQRPGLEE